MMLKHLPSGIVHKGKKDGTTGCGTNTKSQSDHWIFSSQPVSCAKNGCNN